MGSTPPTPSASVADGEPAGEADTAAARIALAWRELRRGASMAALRPLLFGDGADALEAGQYDTLDLLVRQDSWRMSALAEALRVDPSTATRAVQRLTKLGLAERHGCTQDGRVVLVRASAEGRARHGAIAAHRRQIIDAVVVAPFDDDERAKLAELLDRMVGAMDDFVAHRSVAPA